MYRVDEELCLGCAVCVQACPQQAIQLVDGRAHIVSERCTDCGVCAEACPQGAIRQVAPEPVRAAAQPIEKAEPIVPVTPMTPAKPPQPVIHAQGEVLPEAKPLADWKARLWPAIGSALIWAGRELLPELLASWRLPAAQTPSASTRLNEDPRRPRSRAQAKAPFGRQKRRRLRAGWRGGR
ncbi:MAG: 4Fe-4S dicluster domain-containing protein [Chloroflexi bacterium]|nr:4Fe-4S dicluster domain-containing protein [Chloroflexota bacterium]